MLYLALGRINLSNRTVGLAKYCKNVYLYIHHIEVFLGIGNIFDHYFNILSLSYIFSNRKQIIEYIYITELRGIH